MNTVIEDLEIKLRSQIKCYSEEKDRFMTEMFELTSIQREDSEHSLKWWENRINETSRAIIILKKHMNHDERNQTVRINQD